MAAPASELGWVVHFAPVVRFTPLSHTWHGLSNAVYRFPLRCVVLEILRGGGVEIIPPAGSRLAQTPAGARVNKQSNIVFFSNPTGFEDFASSSSGDRDRRRSVYKTKTMLLCKLINVFLLFFTRAMNSFINKHILNCNKIPELKLSGKPYRQKVSRFSILCCPKLWWF